MIISEKKNYERGIFRNLMGKSSLTDRRNVEINVKIYVDSYFNFSDINLDTKKQVINVRADFDVSSYLKLLDDILES